MVESAVVCDMGDCVYSVEETGDSSPAAVNSVWYSETDFEEVSCVVNVKPICCPCVTEMVSVV